MFYKIAVNPYMPSVAFFTENSHLNCTAYQMSGFYQKYSTDPLSLIPVKSTVTGSFCSEFVGFSPGKGTHHR